MDDGTEMARDALETAGQAMGFARSIVIHPMPAKAMPTCGTTVSQDLGKQKIRSDAEGAAGWRGMDRVGLDRGLAAVHDAIGATLNDLVLTAVSGAVGRYHAKRGVPVETLRAMVPMNLRADHERDALGNRLGFLNISLPVGEADPRLGWRSSSGIRGGRRAIAVARCTPTSRGSSPPCPPSSSAPSWRARRAT
jgi:hypothetical protein